MSITAEQLIAEVLDETRRYDLLAYARNRLRTCIQAAHAVDIFYPDLNYSDFISIDPVTPGISVTEALPSNFRVLNKVERYDSNQNPMAGTFVERTGELLRDYFGYLVPNTYLLAGGNITINYGIQQNGAFSLTPLPSYLRYSYYAIPSYEIAEDGTVSTDSWMLANDQYDAIQQRLIYYIYKKAGKMDIASSMLAPQVGEIWQADQRNINQYFATQQRAASTSNPE